MSFALAARETRPRALTGWWPASLSGVLALLLYARTLAPGLTWAHDGADGGDFLAAALTGGVPHPPGYPVYQILLRGALALFPIDPARLGNWLSAACAALAVGLFADTVRRMLRAGWPDARVAAWSSWIAVATALAWAASPTFWGQAVITEAYALNALAVVGLLWVARRWSETVTEGKSGRIWLALAGLVLGLGLGVHLSLLLLVPAINEWLLGHRKHVHGGWGWSAFFALLIVGLCAYAYLPIAAANGAPVNWGDPRTPDRFLATVTARIYRTYLSGITVPHVLSRLVAWAGDAARQLGGGPWGAAIALAGLWWVDRHEHAWWRATGLMALLYSAYAIIYRTNDSFVYLIPVWCVACLWLAAGLAWGIDEIAKRVAQGGDGLRLGLALVAVVALPALSVIRFWPENNLNRDGEAQQFYRGVLNEAAPDGLILTATDGPTFALWYAIYGRHERQDLAPLNVSLYRFPWYRSALVLWHPDLFAGKDPYAVDLSELVMQAAQSRPVYRAEEVNLSLTGFAEEPGDLLTRMRPAP